MNSPKNDTKLRVAKVQSLEQLEQAYHIRKKVFVEEQGVSLEDELDGLDEESEHYLVYLGDTPSGAARWRRTDEGIKLERFCVLPAFRGRGLAGELIRAVMADVTAVAEPGEQIYLHAQTTVIPLYEAAGFRKVGNEFLECNIRHQTMVYSGNSQV